MSKSLDNYGAADSDSFKNLRHRGGSGAWKPIYPEEIGRSLTHVEANYNYKLLTGSLANYRIYPNGQTPSNYLNVEDFSGQEGQLLKLAKDGDQYYWTLVWVTGADGTNQGQKGEIGFSGPKGDKGEPALDNSSNMSSTPGPSGPKGDRGVKGNDSTTPGPSGPKGDKGEVGNDSITPGPSGPKGDKGVEGNDSTTSGPSGPKGQKGEIGASGPDSKLAGPSGPKGDKGVEGNDSTTSGPKGQKGEIGASGPSSTTGSSFSTNYYTEQDDGTTLSINKLSLINNSSRTVINFILPDNNSNDGDIVHVKNLNERISVSSSLGIDYAQNITLFANYGYIFQKVDLTVSAGDGDATFTITHWYIIANYIPPAG